MEQEESAPFDVNLTESRILVALPVDPERGFSEIRLDDVQEVVGFLYLIAAARIVVDGKGAYLPSAPHQPCA